MKIPKPFNRFELTQILWGFRKEFLVVGVFSMVANLLMLTPTFYMLQVYDRIMLSMNYGTLIIVSLNFDILIYYQVISFFPLHIY